MVMSFEHTLFLVLDPIPQKQCQSGLPIYVFDSYDHGD